jgi:hypothetical protein
MSALPRSLPGRVPMRSPGVSRRRRVLALSRTAVLGWVPLGLALLLWAVSLSSTNVTQVSGYGLLAGLPPAYYVALAVLTCGFALAATHPDPRPRLMSAHVVGLVAMLHATASILYDEPRYTWTYKHVGVIDYVMTHGQVDRSVDIYQNWPGFFALNAWVSKVAGIAPLDYAGWAQPFFGLLGVAAVVFAVRGVTRDVRLQWTAAWLFVVANWVGQDYLAPQAFAFVLVLLALGLAVRCAPFAAPPRTQVGWGMLKLANRVGEAFLRGRAPRMRESAEAPLSPRAALAVGAVLAVAVVISHQLSPAILILSVVALVVATWRPPLWIVAGLVALEAWWLALGYDFVSQHFKLFEFDPSASARESLGGLPGAALGANLSRIGVLLMLALALVGLLRRVRGGRWDGAALVLALSPALVLLFQSYGGEGPLRVYLFALPWLALFGAVACMPSRRERSAVRRSWRIVAATLAVGACTLFGLFGQEPLNYIAPDDVAVSRWTLDHTAPGSSLTIVAPNFPERVSGRYAEHLDEIRDLLQVPGFSAFVRGERATMPGIAAFMRKDRAAAHYLVLSPSQERYLRYHDIGTGADYDRMTRALRASPDLRLVYRHGDALVFALAPSLAPRASLDRTRDGA